MIRWMHRILLASVWLFAITLSVQATWWEEATLSTNPEGTTVQGINDSLATASADTVLNSFPNSGTGTLANDSDDDWYQLANLSSGTNQFLKIDTDSTRVNLRLRDGSYNYMGYASQGSPLYFKLPSSATTYYIEANRGGDYTYRIVMTLVDSATISGQVQLQGLVNSTSNSLTVYSYDEAGYELTRSNVTDPGGNYTLYVPASVSVYGLGAERTEYDYQAMPPYPSDWFYGLTRYLLPATITLGSGGSSTGNDFKVYPEAIITGTITSGATVTIELDDPYTQQSIKYESNTSNAYVLRNIPPGSYTMTVKPDSGSFAAWQMKHVRPVEGKTTTIDINLTSGYTVSGTITPNAPTDTEIQLNWRGQGQAGGDGAYDRHYRVSISAGQSVYVMNNVPNGEYDMVLGNEGPSSYPVIQVTVNNGNVTNANFSTNFDAFISGIVSDNTGLFPDLTNLMVVGMAKGQTGVANTPMYFGAISNTLGAFAIAVPDYNETYDLFVADFNGDYPIKAHSYDWVTSTTDASITIESNGNSIYGTMAHSSGKSLETFSNENGFIVIMRNIGGVDRLVDLIIDSSSNYSTGPFLDGIPNTPYSVAVNGYADYMEDFSITRSMVGNNEQVNITFSTDISKDDSSASIFNLEPVHGSVTTNPRPTLFARVWDNYLGAGVNTGSLSVSLNSAPVSVSAVPGEEGQYSFSFTPSSDLLPADNPHNILVTIDDNSTNPTVVPTAYVSWDFYIATYTPTASPVPTMTSTPTPTSTLTNSPTPTVSPTITLTPLNSLTPTESATVTVSATTTLTPTESATLTVSATVTPTSTSTPTATYSSTATPTVTPTSTMSSTVTVTYSPTETSTFTTTPTGTVTVSTTATPTVTLTSTESVTPTQSITFTVTPTETSTSTVTLTHTATSTTTVTPTATHSATTTSTSTVTVTPTISATSTISSTVTRTATVTRTVEATDTPLTDSIAKKIVAYPQPAREVVSFNVPEWESGTLEIRIYSFSGELIAKVSEFYSNQSGMPTWQIKDVGSGIYLAVILIDGEVLKKVKIAVTN